LRIGYPNKATAKEINGFIPAASLWPGGDDYEYAENLTWNDVPRQPGQRRFLEQYMSLLFKNNTMELGY